MSRDVAAQGEAILIQHSIKAGAVFLSAHAPAFAPKKSNNEWKENDDEIQTF